MLSLLFTSLLLTPPVLPPVVPHAAAKAEAPATHPPAHPPAKAEGHAVSAEATSTSKPMAVQPHSAPPKAKPPVRKQTASSEEQRRLAEAEARVTRLVTDNAKLQQEMARVQGISFAEVTTSAAALAELQAGNARFVAGKRIRTLLSMQDTELRSTLAAGQAPFAVIVTCSDSRLADNLIFDQELGRLFTVREAGNSPDIQSLASVEYALEHLGSKLVVVLGHTSCGAVKAVYEAHGKPLPGNLWSLQAAMTGLLESTHEDPNETATEYVRRLEIANATRQAQGVLDRSEIVRHLAGGGKVKVVPALYDLASGQVRYLELPRPGEATAH